MARSPLADAESEELNRNFEKLSLSSGAVVGTRKTTKQNTPVTTASKYAVIGVDVISGQFSILPALYDTEAQASEVSEGLKAESVSVVVVPTQTWMPIKALSDMVGKKVPKTRSKAVESEEKITKAPKKDSGKESVGSSSEAKKKEKQATDEKPRRKEGGPLIKVDETKLARYEELVKAEESNIAAYETLPPIDYKGWEMKLGPIKEVLKEKIKDLKNVLQEVDGDLASKLKPSLQSYLDIVASLRSFAHSAKGHPCAGGLARALGRIKKHSNWTHHGENETGGEKYIITNTNQVLMLRDVSNIVQTIVKRQRLLRQIETSMAVQGQKGVYFTVYAEQEHLCIDLQKIFTGQG